MGKMTFLQPWGIGTTPTHYTIQTAISGFPGAPLHTQVQALQGRAQLLLTLHAHRLGTQWAQAQHSMYTIAF